MLSREALAIDRARTLAVVAIVVGFASWTLLRLADRSGVVTPPPVVGDVGSIADERPDEQVVVERAIDGDTLLLADGRRVRLLGIDTPETKHPNRPPEPWGAEASAFTRDRIEGRTVGLFFDTELTDRYGRTLAWVAIDGSLLNVELVRAGLSRAVLLSPLRPDFRRQLQAAEKAAVADRLGIHSPHPPTGSIDASESVPMPAP